MPIYPTEASWTPSTSSSPDPLYQDTNITVYGIPILPSSDSVNVSPSISDVSPDAQSSDHHLKRKREASPDPPSKRPALMAEQVKSLEKPPSLGDIIQQADFTPMGLTGNTAQEWRRLMIDMMFPGIKEKMEAQKRKHRKERDRDRVSSPSKKSDKNAGSDVLVKEDAKSMDTDMVTSDNKGAVPPDDNSGSALCTPSNVSILLTIVISCDTQNI
jgi:ribonuclease Z